MYHIAICDDEPQELAKAERLLEDYRQIHPNYNFTVHQFTSMDVLLDAIGQAKGFDLLLLDVYLPGKTGIEGARTLRRKGMDFPIIFLTTSKEHAVEAFEVDAVQYLIKPVDSERFHSTLDKVVSGIKEERRRYIAVRAGGKLRRIALRNIVYCESNGNYQCITCVDGVKLRVRMTLAELHGLIGDQPDFVRVGVAYLINLNHVGGMSSKEIQFNNLRKIGIPRGAYPALKDRYFEFYCEMSV